jgi:hypothetical protein
MQTQSVQRWTGFVMVGDGLAGLIWPCRYLRKLKVGPQPINQVLEALAQRPVLTRALCVVEVAIGARLFRR